MTSHPNRGRVRDWASYLKAFRERHGLDRRQLADLLMIPARTVETWENEERNPAPYLKLALRDIASRL